MKLKLLNLGVLKHAEFELGKFTIICGKNNTGKTYATYALFGFLSFWREAFSIKIPDEVVNNLQEDGYVELDVQQYIKKAAGILEEGCQAYTRQLPSIFASSNKNFSETKSQ